MSPDALTARGRSSDRSVIVHALESPSAADLMDGRTEGRLLVEALNLGGIECCYNLCVSYDAFVFALYNRLGYLLDQGRRPVLHLSTHGNAEGIELTSGQFITWEALRELLIPVNAAVGGNLLICMSACHGFSACRMAMTVDGNLPFLGLVAHTGEATWPDAGVAFVTFYHLVLLKGRRIPEAVQAMRAASGDQGFTAATGLRARDAYLSQFDVGSVDASQLPKHSLP